jgi:hypothetical protein
LLQVAAPGFESQNARLRTILKQCVILNKLTRERPCLAIDGLKSKPNLWPLISNWLRYRTERLVRG